MRTTDGTQWLFVTYNGEMRCTQIKDRNGNYISVNYNGYGHVTTVTDTLGRVVTFNYDGDQNLISITQPWNGQTRTWATFYYGQAYIQPNFPGLYVNGPNYAYQTVLTRVALSDGFYHDFTYNSWGQVYQVARRAPDNHLVSYVYYNLPLNSSVAQSDCPRFTQQRDWAENWNGGAEAVSTYAVAADGSWSQVTMPDNTTYAEYFATTANWQKGLTTRTEVWLGAVLKKWTTISWTQDDVNLGYPQNPRVVETNVYDVEGNRKRTTFEYTWFSLPSQIREWGGVNADQVLRRTETNYRWEEAYIGRRVIGLANAQMVYEGESTLASKVEYHYDWWDWGYMQAVAPGVQHDTANYGSSFYYGRGILTGVRRYNINAPYDPGQGIWVHLQAYNLAGSTVWKEDALGHRTSISYTDSFSDGVNRNSLAYPTTVTDSDGFSSTTQYSYDMGAVTRTQEPLPQDNRREQSRHFNTTGRVASPESTT